MNIVGFVLIVSGVLVVTYFSGSKSQIEKPPTLEYKTEASTNISSSGTVNKKEEVSGRIRVKNLQTGETGTVEEWDFDPKKFQKLDSPVKTSNYDYEKAKAAGLSDEEIQNYIATKSSNGTVIIRNKATGEIQKIPKSQLANYISSSKPQPKIVKASDKALKLSAYIFVASNEKQRSDLMSRFSNGTNDLKEAVKNLALQLDSNPEATTLAEKAIAQDIANKKSQSDNQTIIEYHTKEYERLKAEVDSLPSSTSYTYTGGTKNTTNTQTKPGSMQVNPYQDNTQEITHRLKNVVNSDSSGLTYFSYGDGTLGTAQKDSNGNIIYGDSKGNFSITTHDSLGNTNTSDGKGRFIDTQTDSLGNKIYSDGKGLFGSSSRDSLGNIYYSDNYGNSILCQTNSLGIKTCY